MRTTINLPDGLAAEAKARAAAQRRTFTSLVAEGLRTVLIIRPRRGSLVYAFRREAPRHETYARWLAGVVAGHEEIGLHDTTLAGFARYPGLDWFAPGATTAGAGSSRRS